MSLLNMESQYNIEFILFERTITKSSQNEVKIEYLIKWENYDFSECTFINATLIDNKQQQYTPFFYWNQLSKKQKQERALFCKDWDNKTKDQKNILGVQYLKQFKQSMDLDVIDSLKILSSIVKDDENLDHSNANKLLISPPKKKRKINIDSISTISEVVVLLLATYKDPNKKTIFNSTVDQDHFKSISYSKKQYPSNSFVHWIVINKKKTIQEYIQQVQNVSKDNPEIIWLQEKIKQMPFSNYVAYLIIKHGDVKNVKVPDYIQSRRGKFNVNKKDIDKIFKNNEYICKLLNDKKINLKFYGMTCDFKMISLISDDLKKVEFRSKNFLKLNDVVYCKTKQLKKTKKGLQIIPHRKDIKQNNVTNKIIWTQDIDNKWKQKHKNFIYLEIGLIEIFEYSFFNKIFTSWIFKKRLATKNLNPCIVSHNRNMLIYAGKCYNRLMDPNESYWRKHSMFIDKKNYCCTNYKFTILINVLIYFFMIPWHIENALLYLLNEKYKSLAVPILNVLGFIHIPKCCDVEMHYFFKNGKNTSNYQWKCNICKKIQSAWKNTLFHEFNHWNPLLVLYHIWKLSNINALQKHQVDAINVQMTLWKKVNNKILLDVRTYCHKYYLICGKPEGYQLDKESITLDTNVSENNSLVSGLNDLQHPVNKRDVCIDHAFIGKNKYGRGYLKDTTKIQILGFHDKTGIFVNQIIDTQNKIETEYYIQKYTRVGCHIDTDKAKCFNGIFLLQRNHRSVNHSGELVEGKFVRFKNPQTGACTNAQEGSNGRICQHLKIQKPTSLRNVDVFEQYLSLHDLRYNRTDNQPTQIFLNYLMILSIINPPNQPKIIHEERKTFDDIYYVESIIGEDKDEDDNIIYLVKWENFPYYKSTWQYKQDFITETCINEWHMLDQKQKDKLFKKYINSIDRFKKKNLTQGCIKGFKIYKFYKFIGNLVWSRAIDLIKNNNIQSCVRALNNKNHINAVVKSQYHKTVFYRLTIIFKKNELVDYNCTCKDFARRNVFGPTLLCKHITAVCLHLSDDKYLHILDENLEM